MFSCRQLRALALAAVPAASLFIGLPASHAAPGSTPTLLSQLTSPQFASALRQPALNALLSGSRPSPATVSGPDYTVVAQNETCDGGACPAGPTADYSSFSVIQVSALAIVKDGPQSFGLPDRAGGGCVTLIRTQTNPTLFAATGGIGEAGVPNSTLYSVGHIIGGTAGAFGNEGSTRALGLANVSGAATPTGMSNGYASFTIRGGDVTDNTIEKSVGGSFSVTTTGVVQMQTYDQYLHPVNSVTLVPGSYSCQVGQPNGSFGTYNLG